MALHVLETIEKPNPTTQFLIQIENRNDTKIYTIYTINLKYWHSNSFYKIWKISLYPSNPILSIYRTTLDHTSSYIYPLSTWNHTLDTVYRKKGGERKRQRIDFLYREFFNPRRMTNRRTVDRSDRDEYSLNLGDRWRWSDGNGRRALRTNW